MDLKNLKITIKIENVNCEEPESPSPRKENSPLNDLVELSKSMFKNLSKEGQDTISDEFQFLFKNEK